MPSSAKDFQRKMEEAEQLEQILDQIEKEWLEKQQQAAQQKGQNEQPPAPPKQAQPQIVTEPPQPQYRPPPPSYDEDRRNLMIIAERLSERTGRPVDQILMALEELYAEDKRLMDVIRRFSMIKRDLATGEVSGKYADVASARLLTKLSKRLESKFDRGGFGLDEILELYKIKLLEKILMVDEDDRKQPVYRIPLIDPNTGEIVRDQSGNPVFIESTVPIPMPFMQNNRNPREEELRHELEQLREELRKMREEEMRKKEIEKLMEKISELETKLIELKSGGERGGGPSSLNDMVKMIQEAQKALETLGFKVQREEKKVDPVFELQKKNLEIREQIWRNLAPALAELVKDPRKLAQMIRDLASLLSAMRKPNVMAQVREAAEEKVVEELPKLEEYLGG